MKTNMLFLFLLLPLIAYAQNVKVADNINHEPVVGAKITDGRLIRATNESGEADISALDKTKRITFSHPAMETLKTSWQDLEKSDFQVEMQVTIFSAEITITSASKREQMSSDIPAKTTRITSEIIEARQPQTTADLIGASDEIFIQKSQLGGGSPMMRGFSANRILLVVDGVRMNNAIYREGNLQNIISIDPHSLQSAEAVFGPSSVIYGSDAIGGVLAFNTLDPAYAANGELLTGGSVFSRYASGNKERTAHADLHVAGDKWAFAVSGSFSDFDDQKMGSNGPDDYLRTWYLNDDEIMVQNPDPRVQKFSGYDQGNLLGKFKVKPAENWEIKYEYIHSETSDVPRYDRLIQLKGDLPSSAEWYYGPQKWRMHVLSATYEAGNSLYDVMNIVAGYQFFQESRHDRKYGSSSLRNRTETVDAYSLNLDFDKQLDSLGTLFYGVEYITNTVGSTAFTSNVKNGEKSGLSTRYPDGSTWKSLAAYVNLSHPLTDKLNMVSGLRYNYVNMASDFDLTWFDFPFSHMEIDNSALTGSLGFAYHPSRDTQYNLNISTGFRSPNIDDTSKVFDSAAGSVVVPNEGLKPEYAWSIDAGMTKRVLNWLQIDLGVFYSLLQDAMVRRDFSFDGQEYIMYDGTLSRVQAIQNAEEAYVAGFTVGANVFINSRWSMHSRYNFSRGETDLEEPLRHVSPDFGNFGLNYYGSRINGEIDVRFNSEIPFDRLAPSEIDKPYLYAKDDDGNPYCPAWFTLNSSISYQINEQLSLVVMGENLLDKRYQPYSSGIAAVGRNLVASVMMNF